MAPFGKGLETVVDESVRKVWQIDANLLTISQKWLQSSLPKLVASYTAQLGVSRTLVVQAQLYKMLLYEEGGHFKRHKDTEKAVGMFGSLLIQLPAIFEGGALVVQHQGETKTFAHAEGSGDAAFATALYADCEHTLEPVTKGLRLVLAFNLVRTGGACEVLPCAGAKTELEPLLVRAAMSWPLDNTEPVPEKLALRLEHEYTPTNLSFNGLKGKDAIAARCLRSICDPSTGLQLFSVHLARIAKHVTGVEDSDGSDCGIYGGRRSMAYVSETEYITQGWISPADPVNLDLQVNLVWELLLDESEKGVEQTAVFRKDHDHSEYEGYQGNYAGTAEYWYDSAVLVFWPAEWDFKLKLSHGFAEALKLISAKDEEGVNAAIAYIKSLTTTKTFHSKIKDVDVVVLFKYVSNVNQAVSLLDALSTVGVFSVKVADSIRLALTTFGHAELEQPLLALVAASADHRKCIVSTIHLFDKLTSGKKGCQYSALRTSLVNRFAEACITRPSGLFAWKKCKAEDCLAIIKFFFNEEICHNHVERLIEVLKELTLTTPDMPYNVSNQMSLMSTHIQGAIQLVTSKDIPVSQTSALNSLRLLVPLLFSRDTSKSRYCYRTDRPCIIPLFIWALSIKDENVLQALVNSIISNQVIVDRFFYSQSFITQEVINVSLAIRQLIQYRIDDIKKANSAPSKTSWSFPKCSFWHEQEIVDFLKGETTEFMFKGHFDSIAEARKFAQNLSDHDDTYSVSCVCSGTGRNAAVTITKTRAYFDGLMKVYEELNADVTRLTSLLQSSANVTSKGNNALEVESKEEQENRIPTAKRAKKRAKTVI